MESTFAIKAEENLRAAEVLYEKAMYNASANRAYYAALQAAVVALLKGGIRLERIDHEKVQAQFSGKLIRRRKLYPGRLRSHLQDLQMVRDVADYRTGIVSRKRARRQLRRAREFVETVQQET